MKRINTHQMGIAQGTALLFSDFEVDGEMWTGTGPREIRREVIFDDAFESAPTVHVSLSMIDIDSATNPRVDISSAQVSETGFTIVFQTWGDTRIARARADWLAMGPIRHEEDWDLGY